jgi:hypothetical protein
MCGQVSSADLKQIKSRKSRNRSLSTAFGRDRGAAARIRRDFCWMQSAAGTAQALVALGPLQPILTKYDNYIAQGFEITFKTVRDN